MLISLKSHFTFSLTAGALPVNHFLGASEYRDLLPWMLFGVLIYVCVAGEILTPRKCVTCAFRRFFFTAGTRALTRCQRSPFGRPPSRWWGGYYLCGCTQISGRSKSASSSCSSRLPHDIPAVDPAVWQAVLYKAALFFRFLPSKTLTFVSSWDQWCW